MDITSYGFALGCNSTSIRKENNSITFQRYGLFFTYNDKSKNKSWLDSGMKVYRYAYLQILPCREDILKKSLITNYNKIF